MQANPENGFTLLADAFCYPAPGMLTDLEKRLEMLPEVSLKRSLTAFEEKIRRLSQGEWEELYTRTLDLNPPSAPYIGFQTWGESYQRGVFLSKMNKKLIEIGVDAQGELPDHLIPVLRYLGQAPQPLPELVEVLEPAIQRISAGLQKADPHNPYVDLLDAFQNLCTNLKKEAA